LRVAAGVGLEDVRVDLPTVSNTAADWSIVGTDAKFSTTKFAGKSKLDVSSESSRNAAPCEST
jgi:hypothetical protein